MKVNKPFFSLQLFSSETILTGTGLYCCWLPVYCCRHYYGWPSPTLLWHALPEQLGADLPSNTFLWLPRGWQQPSTVHWERLMEKLILLQHQEAGAVLLQALVKCADEQILERTKSVSYGFAKWMLTCTLKYCRCWNKEQNLSDKTWKSPFKGGRSPFMRNIRQITS